MALLNKEHPACCLFFGPTCWGLWERRCRGYYGPTPLVSVGRSCACGGVKRLLRVTEPARRRVTHIPTFPFTTERSAVHSPTKSNNKPPEDTPTHPHQTSSEPEFPAPTVSQSADPITSPRTDRPVSQKPGSGGRSTDGRVTAEALPEF